MNKNLIAAITQRDGKSLAKIVGNEQSRVINDGIERLIDQFFRQLKQVFPAASQTNLKTQQDEAVAKQQWILAFAENGITTKEQLSYGMARARALESPFMLSPGEFIKLCREGEYFMLGLPSVVELINLVNKYSANRGYYLSPDNYPWESSVHYCLVTKLYSSMVSHNLSKKQLAEECEIELKKLADHIKAGGKIPKPMPLLERKYTPVSKEKALSYLSKIKQKLAKV